MTGSPSAGEQLHGVLFCQGVDAVGGAAFGRDLDGQGLAIGRAGAGRLDRQGAIALCDGAGSRGRSVGQDVIVRVAATEGDPGGGDESIIPHFGGVEGDGIAGD